MDLEFTGKVIAVTGASRGPGFLVAERLAAEGAAVAIAARSASELANAHAAIEGHGGRCLAYACDLAVPGEAAAFIASIVEIYGRLDGLVCNGGLTLKAGAGREAWQVDLALNIGHAVEALEAAAPVMTAPGSILLLSAGREESWLEAAARGALGQAARRFSADLAPRQVRVNLLVPRGQDFADTAAFLLSPRSGGVTGEVIGA
jgi:NAD(P)-dependent dehydrogenase (short-subunit alcohol dehydrogenase family)